MSKKRGNNMKNWGAVKRQRRRNDEARAMQDAPNAPGGRIGELRSEDCLYGIGVWDPVKGIVMPSKETSSKPQGPPLRIEKWVAANSAEWNAKHGDGVGILANDQINIEVGDLTMQGITHPVINRGGRVCVKKGDIDASASSSAHSPSPRE